ncbi:MAG TPA: MYXO-CTERM sorting domain-containing protein [Polyangia bacterium]|nr:MYXO-CTERM sorting domain-containing protein [Polyangia bacterium]
MRRRATALATLAAALVAPAAAQAYVRAHAAQSPQPTFWDAGCQVVTIYLNGFTAMSPDEVAKSIAAAAHAWSPDAVTCPDGTGDGGTGSGHPSFEIITQMGSGPPPNKGPDGINAVIFRTDEWPAIYGDAIAVTSRNTDSSGRIFDADMEVNAVTNPYGWANLDPSASVHGDASIDLQSAMTHEFGHFLGLAHTCYHDGVDPPPRTNDDQGRPSPYCEDGIGLPEEAAVMWYKVEPGAASKRVITGDDARGVCAIYPPRAAAPTCAANLPEDGCACGTAGAPAVSAAALAALAALVAASHRRRAR